MSSLVYICGSGMALYMTILMCVYVCENVCEDAGSNGSPNHLIGWREWCRGRLTSDLGVGQKANRPTPLSLK